MPTPTSIPGEPERPSGKARAFDLLDTELAPIRRYKLLLQTFLRRREPGIRKAIADSIGKNRSFVSQMTSPAYVVPVPARYIRTIAAVAGFSDAERRAFVDAYLEAHPDSAPELPAEWESDDAIQQIVITVPAPPSARARHRLRLLIERTAQEIAATMVDLYGAAADEDGRGAANDSG